jgi:hypothetical protein
MPQICGSNIATGNGIIDFTQNSLYIHYPEWLGKNHDFKK